MKKKYFIILIFLISGSAHAQVLDFIKNNSVVDPSNPTSLFTRYDSHFDLRFDSKDYHLGNLWSLAYAFNNKHQISANALLAL